MNMFKQIFKRRQLDSDLSEETQQHLAENIDELIAGVLAVIGLLIGIPCALAAARLFRHMLFDISEHDPLTLGLVAVILVVVAAVAAYLPVRRATRVDPITALRCE